MGTCAKCHGNKVIECPQCGGRGEKVGVLMNSKCQHCDGTGSVTCPRCGGTGKG